MAYSYSLTKVPFILWIVLENPWLVTNALRCELKFPTDLRLISDSTGDFILQLNYYFVRRGWIGARLPSWWFQVYVSGRISPEWLMPWELAAIHCLHHGSPGSLGGWRECSPTHKGMGSVLSCLCNFCGPEFTRTILYVLEPVWCF